MYIRALLFISVLWMAGGEKRTVVSGGATVADLACASSATLESLGVCIRDQMPKSGSNGFVAPNATEQADWRAVVNKMLRGSCDFTLPASLSGAMRIRTFTDSGNGRNYCVLMEVRDAKGDGVVDRGWGTFIVNNDATRELSHQAPHPITDNTTEIQAITIFKETDSRSYLMAGAPRDANSSNSACQSSFKEADAAHNTANMFHATNQALINWYGAASWNAIQWHGMAADTCPSTDVFPSHGMNVKPMATDKISVLKGNLLFHHPTWDVDLPDVDPPGEDACSLNATDNTQGRLINGVPAGAVCGTPASSYNGNFIHIEQDPGFRNPCDWINPVRDTFPVGKTPPAPTGLTAAAGRGKITLNWNAASGAKSYNVKRSLINGGPYKTIATGVTGATYTNIGLRFGVNYYYVVTAVNAVDESGNSNQASARTRFSLE